MKKLSVILLMAVFTASVFAVPNVPLLFLNSGVNPTTTNDGRIAVENIYSYERSPITVYNYRNIDPCFTVDGVRPRWSPDGSKLAFLKKGSDGIYRLSVVQVLGDVLAGTLASDVLPGCTFHSQITWLDDNRLMLMVGLSLVEFTVSNGTSKSLKTFTSLEDCGYPEHLGGGYYVYTGTNGVFDPFLPIRGIWDSNGRLLYSDDMYCSIRATPYSPYLFMFITYGSYGYEVWSYSKTGKVEYQYDASYADISPNGEYACVTTNSTYFTYQNRIALTGDCNGDWVVDDFDFNLVITNFGQVAE